MSAVRAVSYGGDDDDDDEEPVGPKVAQQHQHLLGAG